MQFWPRKAVGAGDPCHRGIILLYLFYYLMRKTPDSIMIPFNTISIGRRDCQLSRLFAASSFSSSFSFFGRDNSKRWMISV
ncbi:hypothetical protein BDV40DRAFT_277804 [Aspergillus tamarii]|uniref:Uncharacterized protein n=1 Tax=Aspergillus tamarii TaxID=41984 RepID=A0A5N6UG68_ASPTM|nr:hypothetical protein BDV40DRAFT_277804 [Aspergillus tamarii]